MKAITHLRNRFDYAVKNSGTLKVTSKDIEAVNQIIEEENSKVRNTELEDSLILFYLLAAYKVQNENNKAVLKQRATEEIRFPLGLPEASQILNRLSSILDPKHEIIKMIADELWIYQEYERMPKDRDLWLKDMDKARNTQGQTVYLTPQEYIPIPKDQMITFEQVEVLINDALKKAKESFPKFKILSSDYLGFLETKPMNSTNPDRWGDK